MVAVAELGLAHVIEKTQQMLAYAGVGHVFSKNPTVRTSSSTLHTL